ncbi:MAG: 6-carboxytetrahydropterin synthase QueD [Candidatus Riflebacteria bacterium]|nr:6-carboxytetrahydropterin synthase QueD [Candidatus Riflebacteria bacterium]
MLFTTVKFHFDSAHFLQGYPGKCANLHGHRFEVTATVKFSEVNEIGISIDFSDLKGLLKEIADRFDHSLLNGIPPFDKINPTAENLSQYFFFELKAKLKTGKLQKICIWESPNAWVEYEEG